MRAWRAAVNAPSPAQRGSAEALRGQPASTTWVPLGPAPLASDATGDGGQNYNWVSGRATSVLIDPADPSGNTVLLGGAYGGLWKSANAGSLSPSPASVTWKALIDDEPTLAVGAIALQPGNSRVILVGTGETNNTADSYYGLGILGSADGGATWAPPIQSAGTGESFLGVGFSKIAFSTANPSIVVASTAGDNGLYVGLEEDGNATARGLYSSLDGGLTWNRVVLSDGAIPASATAVIYNPMQGAFYAFIRRHGLYSSIDGQHFTRVPAQPGAGLASPNCPSSSNSATCQIYRGEFTVVPGRNEMYVWVVDVQTDSNGNPIAVDEGIWQSLNGGTTWTAIPDNGITNCGDNAFGLENSGCGVEQGWYNLELAAIPDGAATDLYAGAVNLYKCTLAGGTTCTQGDWINLTHVYGCDPLAAPAHVHPNQHGLAFLMAGSATPGYFAHDGGISRTLDGYAGLNTGSCTGTNQFDSLSQSLGSMTEFVSFSVNPTDADILLGGTQGNGSPRTNTATSGSTWQNALSGDGGFTIINPANPSQWFAENPYLTILKCDSSTGTGSDCNDSTFIQVVGSSDLGGDQGAYETPYILDPQNADTMLVGTCRVWLIGTNGTASLPLSNDFDTLGTGVCTGSEINLVTGLAAGGPANASGNSGTVYAVTNGYGPLSGTPGGEVWVTTNAGVNLMTNVTQNSTQNVNPNGYAISSVAMDRSDATGDTAYVGIMGFSTLNYPTSHVWQTTNAGASWTDWSGVGGTELPDAPVNALLVDPQAGVVYAGTDVGVFVSSTTTPSWTEVGPAPGPSAAGFLPNAPVTALQLFNPDAGTKTLLASTYGRGIWNYALLTAPGFTNVISNSPLTVFLNQTAAFNGTLTAQAGYASPVNLSCSGAAPATCTLAPAQVTFSPSSTAAYTLTAGGSVGDYNFNAHAIGTDANAIARDAPIMLSVVDFNLTTPSPAYMSVGQGGTSGTSTFQVTAAGSFSGTVTLSCPAGLPSGATCVFSPSGSVSPSTSAPVTVTLTVTAGVSTPLGGPIILTVAAMTAGAPAAKTQTLELTVTAAGADFSLALTATPNTTVTNQNVTWNGALTAIDGYAGSVALTCTAGAPGICTIAPTVALPTTAGAPFTVTLGSTAAGTFNFTIQGTDGTLTHATPTETLTVGTNTAFTWADTGNAAVTVLAGEGAAYTFSATPGGNGTFGAAVSFGCSNLPALTTCQFIPTSIAAGAATTPVTLTIATTGPNLGTGDLRRRVELHPLLSKLGQKPCAPHEQRPSTSPRFTLAWILLLGIVGIRRKQLSPARFSLHFCAAVVGICLALGLLAEISCGGLAGGSGTPPPVTITVNPGLATLFAAEAGNAWPAAATQQSFTATVNGGSSQTVTWAVTGGSANGTIDATGLYTAPAMVPNPQTATVTATSTEATTGGSAFVTLAVPTALGTTQIAVTATAAGGTAQANVVTLIVQ